MKFYQLALSLILIPSLAFADGRELATKKIQELQTIASSELSSTDSTVVFDAESRLVKKMDAGGYVDFSTSLYGNPLVHMTGVSVPIASVNQGYTFLVGQSGKAIIPNNFTLMASGTVTTATAIGIYCSSGNTIATFPIAMLTTGKPVSPFSSAGNGTLPTLASSLTRGCIAGDSVYISNTGSAAAGATHIMINWLGTVQSNPIQ
jgi:hypothetical protein